MAMLATGAARAVVIEGPRAIVYRPLVGRLASLAADAATLARLEPTTVVLLAGSANVRACRALRAKGVPRIVLAAKDPTAVVEMAALEGGAKCADALVAGWDGLAEGRYDRGALGEAIARLRASTTLPVGVAEPAETLLAPDGPGDLGDFVIATARPFEAGERGTQEACGWTVFRWHDLRARWPKREVVVAAGLPTGGVRPASEGYQRAFFACLESRSVAFAMLEAFDRPGPGGTDGRTRYGLFRADGSPKRWATLRAAPAVTASRRGGGVHGTVIGLPARRARVALYVAERKSWRLADVVSPRSGGRWASPPASRTASLVVLLRRGRRAPETLARRPPIDGDRVLALAELGPM